MQLINVRIFHLLALRKYIHRAETSFIQYNCRIGENAAWISFRTISLVFNILKCKRVQKLENDQTKPSTVSELSIISCSKSLQKHIFPARSVVWMLSGHDAIIQAVIVVPKFLFVTAKTNTELRTASVTRDGEAKSKNVHICGIAV